MDRHPWKQAFAVPASPIYSRNYPLPKKHCESFHPFGLAKALFPPLGGRRAEQALSSPENRCLRSLSFRTF